MHNAAAMDRYSERIPCGLPRGGANAVSSIFLCAFGSDSRRNRLNDV
jgi:hypothetical protein